MVILAGAVIWAAATAAGIWWIKKKDIYSKGAGCILFIFNGIVCILGLWLMSQYGYHPLKTGRYLILVEGLILIAIEDQKHKIISNRALAVLLLIRIAFLCGEIACFPAYWKLILYSSFLGLVIGGSLFLLASLLSRGGLGMGDVKLVAVQGFFLGSQTMISCLIITMILTLLTGLCLIAGKKASLKTELPFGPFLAAGTAITLLMGF